MKKIGFSRVRKIALLVFVAGVALSAVLALVQSRQNTQLVESTLATMSNDISADILDRLQHYEYGLRAVKSAIFAADDNKGGIDRQAFQRLAQALEMDNEFPGARGFGFVRRVPKAEEAAFLAQARADGKSDFLIRQLAPNDGVRYVIQYLEPVSRNAEAIGLDLASESNRKAALDRAEKTGLPSISAPIHLVQASGTNKQAFLFALPIYQHEVEQSDPKTALTLTGWAYAPLVMGEILSSVKYDKKAIVLNMRDVTSPGAAELIFESDSGLKRVTRIGTQTIQFDVFGRRWELLSSATPLFVKQMHMLEPTTVLLLGSVFSLLAAAFFSALGAGRQAKQQIDAEQAQLAAIVSSSNDAIIGKDLDGVITSWNKGAEEIFGYSAAEVLGEKFAVASVPVELFSEEADILERLARGESINHFQTKRHKKDGSVFDVSVTISPIRDRTGKVTGISKTLRDISPEKAFEQRILALNTTLEAQVSSRTEALEKASRFLQTVLDAVPSMIAYWDRDCNNHLANQACYDWFNLHTSTLGAHISQLIGVDNYQRNLPHIEAALRGEPQHFEYSLERPDGAGKRHTLAHYLPDFDAGEVRGFYAIVHDVTEIVEQRMAIFAATRENEVLLRTIDQQMLYSVTDVHGTILSVNNYFCTLTGYTREELLGKTHRLIESATHDTDFWKAMWQTISAGLTWHGEICNRSKSGELQWFDTVISPFVGADGKVERYVAICSDMTLRKAAEVELGRTNVLLENVLNASSEVAIIATDCDGLITIFNSGAEKMLGYCAAEMIGKSSPAPLHLLDEVVARGKQLSDEYGMPIEGFRVFVHKAEIEGAETRNWTYVRKDGSYCPVSLSVTPQRDQQGRLRGYLGLATDISEQLRQQRELTVARDQLSRAADVAELGIWTWDLADNSLLWNDRMFEMYDQPKSLNRNGLGYQHWQTRVHPEDVLDAETKLHASVVGAMEYDPVFRVVQRDGQIIYIQAAAQVERDSNGKALRVTGINRDVTVQRELETRLRLAKELADAASAAKSAFLANMSHEIRTPMNAVLGMLQLVQHTEMSHRQQDYVTKAQMAAKSLLGLLNDILDFSKIDAGKLQLDMHTFALEGLMRDFAVVMSASYGDKKEMELMFDLDTRLPKLVVADRLRLQQVLINLGGNALKFTSNGQVIVSMQLLAKTDTDADVRISISDTGIGISPDQLTRIFDGFVQAEASTTRRYGGTGLGLVISKRLIDLMGGTLQVESELGKGSRFWFDLRLQLAHAGNGRNDDAVMVPAALAHLRVLVVDDNALVLDVLVRTVQGLGWQAESATGGYAAIDRVLQANDRGQAFDVVLMDLSMPDLDGISAAEQIRQLTAGSHPATVIMVSAHGREALTEAQSHADAPFVDFLLKPITPQQLLDSIQGVMTGEIRLPGATPYVADHHAILQGLHLLVVEDNPLNRQVAFELLNHAGAQVDLAEGGIEGVAKVCLSEQRYDVVIMDLQMPDIDGYEATRRIRADPRFATLPILAMTANASQADREACFACGMNEHVGKPIDMEEVLPKLLMLAGRVSVATTLPVAAKISQVTAATSDEDLIIEAMPILLKRFSGNAGMLRDLLKQFIPSTNELLAELERAVDQANATAAAAALHAMKGMTATMGAKALSRRASALEQALKASNAHDLAQLINPAAVGELRQLLDTSFIMLAAAVAAVAAPVAAPDTAAVAKAEAATSLQTSADSTANVITLRAKLEQMVPMLEVGDLRAIDTALGLQDAVPVDNAEALSRLAESVNALDFTAALALVRQLLGEL